MSIRTITKIASIVIPLLCTPGCSNISYTGAERAQIDPKIAGFEKAEIIARIASKEINESSGLAVSKCQNDVFWTHNDSGDGAFLYAFNSMGVSLGTFRVPNVENIDWEDMSAEKTASGECYLLIGEFGDNDRRRDAHKILRVPEPLVSPETLSATRKLPAITGEAEVLRFRYPDMLRDAEALLVEPFSRSLYVITKELNGPAVVFQLEPSFGSLEVQTAAWVAEISLPAVPNGFVTGGDISDDGKHVVLCDYYAGYELQLPKMSGTFNEIWKQKPVAFDLGPREIGEAVAFGNDADIIFATTERLNAPLIRAFRKQK